MYDRGRKQVARAFQFWHQLLVSWVQNPRGAGRDRALIAHLRRIEKRSADTFQHITARGADPVYVLHIMITLCDEDRVKRYVGFPQVLTQEKAGTFPSDLGEFHLITESDLKTIEAALPSYEKAGLTVDQAHLEILKKHFESLPEPPARDGYTAEKAILSTEFVSKVPTPGPMRGRPGDHYFNTAMVLLARHLERTAPHPGARYTSIAALLNAFCPATYEASPLSRESVRQRILSVRDRVEAYAQHFEQWYDEWKRVIHRHPLPFNPWKA